MSHATEVESNTLLRRYVCEGSEEAFRILVERHAGMVHAVARRRLNDNEAMARDVTQAVFTELARRAASLREDTVPGAWLHRVACCQCAALVRSETRRQRRESIAAMMTETDAPDDSTAWAELSPHLDEALDRLPDAERSALLLRFFENRDLRSIGVALGTTEEAARKRVTRALEKLRTLFQRRGITAPGAAVLAALLAARGTSEAAQSLTAKLAATALHQAAASGGAAAAVTFTLMKTATIAAALAAFTLPAAWPLGPSRAAASAASVPIAATAPDATLARLASGLRALKPEGTERELLEMSLLIATLSPDRLDAAQKLITARSTAPGLLLRSLFARRAELDITAALAEAEKFAGDKDQSARTYAWMGLLSVWMKTDPQAALARLQSMDEGIFREATTFTALKYVALASPQQAAEMTDALPPGKAREQMQSDFVDMWAQQHPDAARRWLDARTPDDDRDKAARAFLSKLTYSRPELVWPQALREPDFHVKKDASLFALQQLAVSNPGLAAEALRTLPEDLRSDHFGYNTSPHLARSAPHLLRQLVHDVPAGAYRDGLLMAVIHDPDTTDRRADIETVALHSQPEIRDRILRSRFADWQKADATAARAWLESATLPDELKQQLTRP